ncbi:MAG: MmgE/PrpD family protein [Coxiellaceae bacterium]|nr:MmgE/PrpD family protein [Coxiellaceae bacterium]
MSRPASQLFTPPVKEEVMTASARLAEWALSTFSSRSLPTATRRMAGLALIDQYGLQIGGSTFPWSEAVYQTALMTYGTGDSTVTRHGTQLTAPGAAYVNGCFSHAQDFDDSHQRAQTHPGPVVIPAAMAVAESVGCSGEEALIASAVGIEAMTRLAASICPACIEGGHHTPPTVGPFGAAIASGLLLGLSHEQLTHALGICGSSAGGLVAYTESGGSVKRIHTGIPARAGVEAALLAQRGLTGPSSVIDGKKGLWAVFGRGEAVPERLFGGLGEHYMLDTLMFKPYNCCYLIHPAIEGFLKLTADNGIAAEDIAEVTVGLSDFSRSHAGTITVPHDELGAQFSTSFTLALSLLKGAPGMWSYSPDVITDPDIIDLTKRIHVTPDEQAQAEFPNKNGCLVTIKTTDGRIQSIRITEPKGCPDNLMASDDVERKFFANTVPVIGDERARELYDQLRCFNELISVRELTECFGETITSALSK